MKEADPDLGPIRRKTAESAREHTDAMTTAAAEAVLDRMEEDEAFMGRVREAGGRDASLAVLHAEGFDVTAEDMRDVVLDRFGDQMSPEQLNAISGGLDIAPDFLTGGAIAGAGVALIFIASATAGAV
jgi:predicted ribosomally synthesized peptide with nif11-like leader